MKEVTCAKTAVPSSTRRSRVTTQNWRSSFLEIGSIDVEPRNYAEDNTLPSTITIAVAVADRGWVMFHIHFTFKRMYIYVLLTSENDIVIYDGMMICFFSSVFITSIISSVSNNVPYCILNIQLLLNWF